MNHPIEEGALSPAVRNAVRKDAPKPARMMAARGLLPLPSPDLVTTIYMLSFDGDEDVRQSAEKTLGALPAPVLTGAFDAGLDPRVLDRLADACRDDEHVLQRIALMPATADETLARIAAKASERLVEIIAGMDQRLLGCVALIEAIYMNENTRMSTADRVLEFAVRNELELSSVHAYREMAAAIRNELVADPSEEKLPDDEIFSDVLRLGEQYTASAGSSLFDDFDAVEDGAADAAPSSEKDEKRIALDAALAKMPVSQKIRLALLGTAGHRSRLVRDPNRLVAIAAIKSPKVTDMEAEAFAQSRSVNEDVIRHIAQTREWTRRYTVKKALAMNPKCPLSETLRLIPHLRENDLKGISTNKNIPSALSTAARNFLQQKKKTRGGS